MWCHISISTDHIVRMLTKLTGTAFLYPTKKIQVKYPITPRQFAENIPGNSAVSLESWRLWGSQTIRKNEGFVARTGIRRGQVEVTPGTQNGPKLTPRRLLCTVHPIHFSMVHFLQPVRFIPLSRLTSCPTKITETAEESVLPLSFCLHFHCGFSGIQYSVRSVVIVRSKRVFLSLKIGTLYNDDSTNSFLSHWNRILIDEVPGVTVVYDSNRSER